MTSPRTALITGASRGLGLALAGALSERGWILLLDARGPDALAAARNSLGGESVTALAGSITDPLHRAELADRAARIGALDLVVNNASTLGASPLPPLLDYPIEAMEEVFQTNVLGPLALLQVLRPHLRRHAMVVNVTSDAAVEAYEGWGAYGASKAALEQMSAVLAAENPDLRVYWVDPGDMRTVMHQEAFPGEDISDRPLPEAVVPGFLALIESGRPSGRYAARELAPAAHD